MNTLQKPSSWGMLIHYGREARPIVRRRFLYHSHVGFLLSQSRRIHRQILTVLWVLHRHVRSLVRGSHRARRYCILLPTCLLGLRGCAFTDFSRHRPPFGFKAVHYAGFETICILCYHRLAVARRILSVSVHVSLRRFDDVVLIKAVR